MIDPGQTDLERQQLLTEEEYRAAREQYGPGSFEVDMGAEAIRKLLACYDLVDLSEKLRVELGRNKLETEKERPDQSSENR